MLVDVVEMCMNLDLLEEGIDRMDRLVACPLTGTVVEGVLVDMECQLDQSCSESGPTKDERGSYQ